MSDGKPECEYLAGVHHYHDLALGSAERERVAAHVAACPACSAELARLTRLSALLALAQPAELTVFGLARVRARLVSARLRKIAQDQRWRVVRVGQWLTAAAAGVMLVCGLALYASDEAPRTAQTAQAKITQTPAVVSDDILKMAVEAPGDVSAQSEQEQALLLAVSPKGEQP